ncbi:hypothetical protein [Sorangium sp. So ce1097]
MAMAGRLRRAVDRPGILEVVKAEHKTATGYRHDPQAREAS